MRNSCDGSDTSRDIRWFSFDVFMQCLLIVLMVSSLLYAVCVAKHPADNYENAYYVVIQ